jgi:hypothetical protein
VKNGIFLIVLSLTFSISACRTTGKPQPNHRYVHLDQAQTAGMFAVFSYLIAVVKKFDTKEIDAARVDFGEHGPYYDPKHGPNWWTYYFEPIHLGQPDDRPFTTVTGFLYNDEVRVEYSGASRHEVHSYVKKYFHLKPFMKEKIKKFEDSHFKGHYVIGIHYRGTDKITEAPRTDYERVPEAIKQVTKNLHGDYKLFITTNEVNFLKFMKEGYPGKILQVEGTIYPLRGWQAGAPKWKKWLQGRRRCPHGLHTSLEDKLSDTHQF